MVIASVYCLRAIKAPPTGMTDTDTPLACACCTAAEAACRSAGIAGIEAAVRLSVLGLPRPIVALASARQLWRWKDAGQDPRVAQVVKRVVARMGAAVWGCMERCPMSSLK